MNTQAITQSIDRQSRPITRQQTLSLEDLQLIQTPFEIRDNQLVIDKSRYGWKLRTPTSVPLDRVLEAGEKGLVAYILESLTPNQPRLIPLVFQNRSLLRLARHLKRGTASGGSAASLYAYTNNVDMYSRWLGHSPDSIIADCKPDGNIPDAIRVDNHAGFLGDYVAELQDDGLAPGTVHGRAKRVRTFYRINGVKLELKEKLSRRVVFKDKVPSPEDVSRLMDLADVRERVIVSWLCLGMFREGTLSKLQLRHISMEDLNSNRATVHVHLPAEILKGQYGDCDAFVGGVGPACLRAYLRYRTLGSLDHRQGRRPPEELTDETPLIRDAHWSQVKPISPKQIRQIVHDLYIRADLLKKPNGRMYELRAHTLRKFGKTRLIAAGVPESHVDYMMAHVTDTYNQVQSLGIQALRTEYENADLDIRPRTVIGELDRLKEIIRAHGHDPDKILNTEAVKQGWTTIVDEKQLQHHRLETLRGTLRNLYSNTTNGNISNNPR
jgi:hypothetical protein